MFEPTITESRRIAIGEMGARCGEELFVALRDIIAKQEKMEEFKDIWKQDSTGWEQFQKGFITGMRADLTRALRNGGTHSPRAVMGALTEYFNAMNQYKFGLPIPKIPPSLVDMNYTPVVSGSYTAGHIMGTRLTYETQREINQVGKGRYNQWCEFPTTYDAFSQAMARGMTSKTGLMAHDLNPSDAGFASTILPGATMKYINALNTVGLGPLHPKQTLHV
ncbi:MAG: hypothetical protein V1922_00965 [bacterium]